VVGEGVLAQAARARRLESNGMPKIAVQLVRRLNDGDSPLSEGELWKATIDENSEISVQVTSSAIASMRREPAEYVRERVERAWSAIPNDEPKVERLQASDPLTIDTTDLSD
jgi:hypothetical protein